MLENLFSSWVVYSVATVVIGSIFYGVWTGMRESREAGRRVYGRLTELFETKPQSYVVRSLSNPDSSNVGSVQLGDDSVITTVLCGPDGIFIDHSIRDTFFSVPWERVDSIEQLSEKRVSMKINDPAGRSTEIVIPWSKDMTLDGWDRYNELNE